MFLIDNLIEKIAGKVIIGLLQKAKTYMDGKKTYAGSALGIVGALVGYFTGNLDAKESAGTIWLSAMLIFREASAAAKAKKAKDELDANKLIVLPKDSLPQVPMVKLTPTGIRPQINEIPGVTSPWPA